LHYSIVEYNDVFSIFEHLSSTHFFSVGFHQHLLLLISK